MILLTRRSSKDLSESVAVTAKCREIRLEPITRGSGSNSIAPCAAQQRRFLHPAKRIATL